MIPKEELAQILDSDFWLTLKDNLEGTIDEEKETIFALDFTDPTSNLKAIKSQAKIEAINDVFTFVDSFKEDSE